MIVGVHITKSATWRGVPEEFENVYHYDTELRTSQADFEELVNDIVRVERTIHTADVSFVRARVHGPTDGTLADGTKDKAADIMRYVVDLTGTGAALAGAAIGPEASYVGRWYLGRSAKGYKQYLKKFFHTRVILGGTGNVDIAFGVAPLTQAQKDPMIAALNDLKNIIVGTNQYNLTNSWGKGLPLGTDPEVADFIHNRQLRRGRKSKAGPVTNPG